MVIVYSFHPWSGSPIFCSLFFVLKLTDTPYGPRRMTISYRPVHEDMHATLRRPGDDNNRQVCWASR